jgi:hypothetical protein
MPADRLTHPRIGHSQKVCALTDTEYRVWETYKWCADDFGVMPKSATKLQGDNEALERHERPVIEAALQRMIDIGLLLEFESQGTMYVCSHNWQTHQKIKYPRATFLPAPPAQVFARSRRCDGRIFSAVSRNFLKNCRESERKFPLLARVGGRETLSLSQTLTLTQAPGKSPRRGPRR